MDYPCRAHFRGPGSSNGYWGNPPNMGICAACFIRDIAGALGLHRASVVQFIRPEIIGFVLGAFITSIAFREWRARGGASPMIRFLLGAFVYFKWEIYWNKTYNGQLITGGIFQHIRHPHYVSLLIVGFGLALFFYSLFALIIAFLAVPIMIWSILDEEKLLLKQYGQKYKDYMKEVPWRLIPKIF